MSYQNEKLKNIALIKTGKLDSNAAVADGAYPFFTCDPNTLMIDDWAYDTEAVLVEIIRQNTIKENLMRINVHILLRVQILVYYQLDF